MAKRDFVFVDEYGDPGPYIGSNSRHFACIAVHVTDSKLAELTQLFAAMRFFRQAYGEIKRLHSNPALRPVLCDMLRHLNLAHGIGFSATHLDKAAYSGPYLAPQNGRSFRNFQLRQVLEWHFRANCCHSSECELVFDRHSLSDRQESNLREYLRGNWSLPHFSHVTAVDSRYVETIQITDLALTLFRKKILDAHIEYQALDVSFIRSLDVSSP